jgi:Subtilase family
VRKRILTALACGLAAAVAMVSGPASAAQPAVSRHAAAHRARPSQVTLTDASAAARVVHTRKVCSAAARPGWDQCQLLVRTTAAGQPLSARPARAAALPDGYGPVQLRSAYELARAAAARGSGQTVALVDAYDDPDAAADLATYRAEYGLPACTVASHCFRKVNQEGQPGPLPAPNVDWSEEISLDLDMVSAVCPKCHIILAEANDNQDYDLAATVATAARLGATQISNSYAEPEYAGETRLEPFYDHRGVEITASAGDDGYQVNYPAASQYVTSVGGTTLWPASNNRGWTETVWSGSGSGCSSQIPKPSWQHDACTHRTDNDVAAVANPVTPVALYDTYGESGWLEAGGTSVASPIVAAVYALIGTAGKDPGGSWWYAHRDDVFPVTSGRDGVCQPAYLCTAGKGYSGPAGVGTPDLTGLRVTPAGCTAGWAAAPGQPVPSSTGVVTDTTPITWNSSIAVLSPDNVWTAGYDLSTAPDKPGLREADLSLLEHWNGRRWTRYRSPDFTNGDGFGSAEFLGLSFDRPDDGWAVGAQSPSGIGGIGAPLVARWNGHQWTPSPVLTPFKASTASGNTEATYPELTTVRAISPDDVWAGGWFIALNQVNGIDGSFMEHWNGSAWKLVSFPGQAADELWDITAFGPRDAWATVSGPDGPVPLHWNGRTWTRSRYAAHGNGGISIESLSGTSPDSIWATGRDELGVSSAGVPSEIPYIEHWNGATWSRSPIKDVNSVEGPESVLQSVTAISPSDAWAAGLWNGRKGAIYESNAYLLMHWNGRQWTVTKEPQSPLPYGLLAVGASSARNVWITGEQVEYYPSVDALAPYLMRYRCGKG